MIIYLNRMEKLIFQRDISGYKIGAEMFLSLFSSSPCNSLHKGLSKLNVKGTNLNLLRLSLSSLSAKRVWVGDR